MRKKDLCIIRTHTQSPRGRVHACCNDMAIVLSPHHEAVQLSCYHVIEDFGYRAIAPSWNLFVSLCNVLHLFSSNSSNLTSKRPSSSTRPARPRMKGLHSDTDGVIARKTTWRAPQHRNAEQRPDHIPYDLSPLTSSLEDASRNTESVGLALGFIGQLIPGHLPVRLHPAARLLFCGAVLSQKTKLRKLFAGLFDDTGQVRDLLAESPKEPHAVVTGVR